MLTKNNYKIIVEIFNAGGDTELKSFSIKHIGEMIEEELSVQTIRKTIKQFLELGYLKEGARQHREKTYYITELGKKKISEVI